VVTNERHRQALDKAIQNIQQAIDGLKDGVSPEFLASSVRFALAELGSIIGQDISEEILSAIFSKFCVGK
jgi:tRNA modification GTPase